MYVGLLFEIVVIVLSCVLLLNYMILLIVLSMFDVSLWLVVLMFGSVVRFVMFMLISVGVFGIVCMMCV